MALAVPGREAMQRKQQLPSVVVEQVRVNTERNPCD
jgi:hypothetical protein